MQIRFVHNEARKKQDHSTGKLGLTNFCSDKGTSLTHWYTQYICYRIYSV